MTFIRPLLGLFLLAFAQAAIPEYRSNILVETLGKYIAAADFMAKLKDSECHYTVKEKTNTKNQILFDADLVLARPDFLQLVKYLKTSEYQGTINKTYENAVLQAKLFSQNREKACEYLYSNFDINYRFARERWYFVKKFHSR